MDSSTRSTRRLPFVAKSLNAFAAYLLVAGSAGAALEGDAIETDEGNLVIHPINHATLALGWNDETIYVDPVGGAERFADLPPATLILVTDIHGDHLNVDTLQALRGTAPIVAPAAVAEQLPESLRARTTILANGETKELRGIAITGVPMYNLTEERLRFHSKGRGNGYVLNLAGTRVYLSGDTEDIPEMRALEDIDVAFVCMNLPYTMTVEQAADAVREFQPDVCYPYHHRGSDVERFKQLVGSDAGVDVRLRDWY